MVIVTASVENRKKNLLGPYFSLPSKSQMIKYFCFLSIFLTTKKTQATNPKLDKWDYISLNNICAPEDVISLVEKNASTCLGCCNRF